MTSEQPQLKKPAFRVAILSGFAILFLPVSFALRQHTAIPHPYEVLGSAIQPNYLRTGLENHVLGFATLTSILVVVLVFCIVLYYHPPTEKSHYDEWEKENLEPSEGGE